MFDTSRFNRLRRTSFVALGVMGLHAGLIWALQSSPMPPTPELLVPVRLLSQAADPPAQATSVAPPQKALATKAQPKAASQTAPAPVNPESRQVATAPAQASPAPTAADTKTANAPASVPASVPATSPAPSGTAAVTPPTEATPSSAGNGTGTSTAAAPAVELPSSNADYLRNPKPVYPALSKRLNEQGTVVYSVLIAADGRPVSAKLVQSSGFDRLDKAAYEAVMQWRYVPGKRQGVPEAMTFNVPIKWVLE